jgi:hypothetical protein
MNDEPDDLDQAEEEILASTLSDEALETAAGSEALSHSSAHVMGCCATGVSE